MLKQPLAGPVRLALGATLAFAASSAAAVALWQAQPERPVVLVASAAYPVLPPAAPRAEFAPLVPGRVAMPMPADLVTTVAVAPRPVAIVMPVLAPASVAEPTPAPAPAPAPEALVAEVTPAPAPAADASIEAAATATPGTTTPAKLKPPRVSRIFLADVPRWSRDRDRVDRPNIVVQVEVDAEGRPRDAVIVHSELDRAHEDSALRAVSRWRFEPARQDGVAVAATVLVPVAFDDTEQERQRFQEDFMRHPRPMGMPPQVPSAGSSRPPAKPPARA